MNSCGTCTLCCRLLAVETLSKPQGEWCKHCTPGVGCGIYAERPEQCRIFDCLWLQTDMAAVLRPDRSHVVLASTKDTNGIVAHVHPDYPNAWREGRMGQLLRGLIAKGVVVIMVIGHKRIAYNMKAGDNKR